MGSQDGRRQRHRGRRPHAERSAELDDSPATREQGWIDLQQQAGNRGMGALLRRAEDEGQGPTHPASILERLGKGRPLEGGTRSRMEGALGQDFSEVRIHTDAPDARLAEDLDARAFAVGEHVAFAPGQFQPGTPVGDAVLAHELAHVGQQRGADAVETGSQPVAEHDADRATVGAVAGLWGQAAGFAQSLATSAGPRLRTGLALHRCPAQVEKREPPSYLGQHSRQALADIRDIERRMDIVSALILFGATTGAASPEGLAGEAAGVAASGESTLLDGVPSAMLDVFVIKGHLILQRIDFLRLDHGNDFNAEERAFWDRAYNEVSRLTGRAANKRRSR